jgi:hypothetical protein
MLRRQHPLRDKLKEKEKVNMLTMMTMMMKKKKPPRRQLKEERKLRQLNPLKVEKEKENELLIFREFN